MQATISRLKRRVRWAQACLTHLRDERVAFRCNICGENTSFPKGRFLREFWSCFYCGSNVRWRSVIHALSTELFGESLALPDFPKRPDLTGIGLSDWDGYAIPLAGKLSYKNTYYHQEPLLDITSVSPSLFGTYDFIISSDVFEHISPPISKAFENARRLLKPSGVMILTVPYVEGETVEHFPDLDDYSLQKRGEDWVLLNRTADGRRQEFKDVTFHGGPGTVIEMRLFGKAGLLRDAREAGFGGVKIYDSDYIPAGICWLPYVAEEAPYRPLIYGLDTPPLALRNRPNSTDTK